MQLEGKNIVYIGGFGGVGSKCAEALLSKRVKSLLILDWTPNDEVLQYLQETYKNAHVDYIHTDLTKHDTIAKAFKQAVKVMGSIDVVVNGAGIVLDNNVDMVVQINLTGVMHCSLQAMEYMSKTNGGHGGMVINISSTAGLKTYEVACVYAAANYAIRNFTRSLAKPHYYKQTGVDFVNVCSGLTENPAAKDKFAKYSSESLEEIKEKPQCCKAFAINLTRVAQNAKNGSTWVLENDDMVEYEYQAAKRV